MVSELIGPVVYLSSSHATVTVRVDVFGIILTVLVLSGLNKGINHILDWTVLSIGVIVEVVGCVVTTTTTTTTSSPDW